MIPLIFNQEYVDECIHKALQKSEINQDSWNIDQWRKENPIDYLYMLALIIGYSNDPAIKNSVFQTIYRIVRLYTPDNLVKYYSLTDDNKLNANKLVTLRNQQVYLSKSKAFNDPFDNKAFYYNPAILLDFNELKQHQGKLIDDFSDFNIGCSFSNIGINSMPMWGNYANNHKGYCIRYDTSTEGPNNEINTFAFPIQYLHQRIDISYVMYQQAKMILTEKQHQLSFGHKTIVLEDLTLVYLTLLLSNIKSSEWEHEREFRVSIAANSPKKCFKAIPAEIYIGLNTDTMYVDELLSIGRSQGVPVFKMKMNEFGSTYDLKYDRLN